MKPKFISSSGSNEKHTMYCKSGCSIIMIGSSRDKIIQELFDSALHRYQAGIEQLMVALNHEQIKKNPQRIIKICPFINQFEWKYIDFSSNSKDWKKFETNKKSIALDVLFVPYKKKKIRKICISKYNSERLRRVILLMITNGKKWHYLAVTTLSRLLRDITSGHHSDL